MNTATYLVTGWLAVGGLGLGRAYAQAGMRAAGGLATGTGGRASYSVGQLATVVARGPGGTLSPGVQQPFTITTLGASSQSAIQLDGSVYPNPAPALLHLRMASPVGSGLTWRLTDLGGRQLLSQQVAGPLTTISLADFATGTYLLTVFSATHTLRVFKIVKP